MKLKREDWMLVVFLIAVVIVEAIVLGPTIFGHDKPYGTPVDWSQYGYTNR